MIWLDHSKEMPEGKHALFSGSNYSWTNIDIEDEEEFEERIRQLYLNSFATTAGTLIHTFAAKRLKYRARLTKSHSRDLFIHLAENYIPENVAAYYTNKCFQNMLNYVNDSIALRLDPEVKLYCYPEMNGTADAIRYVPKEMLRIHDLKSGSSKVSLRQLETYAAFCCIEYRINPLELPLIELRIYQNEDVLIGNPTGEDLVPLIKHFERVEGALEKVKRD